jgi:zinc D-Ala-D-Ala carboxypeptidase
VRNVRGPPEAPPPNGKVPASALCPLYGSADERLREDPARAFDAMSRAYQPATTASASPPTSAAGCRASAPRPTCGCSTMRRVYGWYHPAWAEPSGSMPEPWHWEYAG